MAPLLDAKVDHELIRAQIVAYESEQKDALEKRRQADAARQAKRRSRDVTLRHSDKPLATRAEDITSSSVIDKEEKKVSKQRATRLPIEFEPDMGFASGLGLTLSQAQTEVSKFRDYWGSKGSGATKTDWQATWRNWVRTAAERLPRAGPVVKETFSDKWAALERFADERQNSNGSGGIQEAVQFLPPVSTDR